MKNTKNTLKLSCKYYKKPSFELTLRKITNNGLFILNTLYYQEKIKCDYSNFYQ